MELPGTSLAVGGQWVSGWEAHVDPWAGLGSPPGPQGTPLLRLTLFNETVGRRAVEDLRTPHGAWLPGNPHRTK